MLKSFFATKSPSHKFIQLIILASLYLSGKTEIRHSIKILHPGISLTEKTEKTLFQIKGKDGQADQFYMNVKTVVCGDSQCKIDTVRIFWNALGFYDKLVLPQGIELEKAEGKHFTKEDYEKLDKILANKNSSLKNVYKEEVVGTETSEGVDAMTGATIILNNNDYVAGAVWTCYTLWHWTNGEIFTIIRDIVGNDLRIESLAENLKKEDIQYKIFALEQLIKRNTYQPEILELVLKQATTNNYVLQKLIIEYLEKASPQIFHSSFEQLLKNEDKAFRLLCWNALLKTKHQLPIPFFEQISRQFSNNTTYQEINLFLNILEKREVSSPIIIQQIMLFLDSEDFIVARRVYWFLEGQELSKREQEKLDDFYKKHANSL